MLWPSTTPRHADSLFGALNTNFSIAVSAPRGREREPLAGFDKLTAGMLGALRPPIQRVESAETAEFELSDHVRWPQSLFTTPPGRIAAFPQKRCRGISALPQEPKRRIRPSDTEVIKPHALNAANSLTRVAENEDAPCRTSSCRLFAG